MSSQSDYEDDFSLGSVESDEQCPPADVFMVPGKLGEDGGFRKVYFATLSAAEFSAFGLNSEIGFLYAILALDGYMEWSAYQRASCSTMVIIFQCISLMFSTTISSPFTEAVITYLFVLACQQWSQFYFLYIEPNENPIIHSKNDVKKATKACNKIALFFKCSKDQMREIASLPKLSKVVLYRPGLVLFPNDENFASSQSEWINTIDSLTIISLANYFENRITGEGNLLSNPLLADDTVVGVVNERTETNSVEVKSVKQGANAKKKAWRKQTTLNSQ
jgi:hypothetical protein